MCGNYLEVKIYYIDHMGYLMNFAWEIYQDQILIRICTLFKRKIFQFSQFFSGFLTH